MNVLMQTPHRSGRRIAELDPFDLDPSVQGATELKRQAGPEVEAAASYGCVDWYAYEPQPTTVGRGAGRQESRAAATSRSVPPGDAPLH